MKRARGPRGAQLAQQRALLASESARIMADQGMRDPQQALRKAAARLGVHDRAALPSMDEIDLALREHQRLFGGEERAAALIERRHAAVEAMRFLAPFQPRLVGAVLDGTADRHSAVQLHLFADDPDAPIRFLQEHDVPHLSSSCSLRVERDQRVTCPLHRFNAGGIDFELCVLPLDALRQPPFAPGSERPMARASLPQLQKLIEEDGSGG